MCTLVIRVCPVEVSTVRVVLFPLSSSGVMVMVMVYESGRVRWFVYVINLELRSTHVTMTDDPRPSRPSDDEPSPARQTVNDMILAGLLDDLMGRVDAGDLTLTGDGGVLPELVKAVLERGLAAELTGHLSYEKGDPAGRGSPNSRNGHSPKTVATEVGDVDLAVPRDRAGSFEPRLVPKGARRTGGLDEMIISLYAGGMTIRDIGHHLSRTLGTELSHDTISKITDAVLGEVKAWQGRPLEELYPIMYLDALVVKVRALAHIP
jgi:putative transposase